MTLTDAFAGVETTQTALQTTDAATVTANKKLADAQAAKAQADTDDVAAVAAANLAIDAAIQALMASKRPVATQVPVPPPPAS